MKHAKLPTLEYPVLAVRAGRRHRCQPVPRAPDSRTMRMFVFIFIYLFVYLYVCTYAHWHCTILCFSAKCRTKEVHALGPPLRGHEINAFGPLPVVCKRTLLACESTLRRVSVYSSGHPHACLAGYLFEGSGLKSIQTTPNLQRSPTPIICMALGGCGRAEQFSTDDVN